jgi:sporulation integral membrane protein YtvI
MQKFYTWRRMILRDYRVYLPIVYKILLIVLLAAGLYFIGLPLIVMLLPFIIAGFVTLLMEPIVGFFQKRLKLSRKLSSLFSLIIVLIIFGAVVSIIIYKIIIELVTLSYAVPEYFKTIDLNNESIYLADLGKRFYLSIPPDVAALIQAKVGETITTVSGYLTAFVTSTLSFILGIIAYLPEIFVFIIITIISIYFMSSDRQMIRDFIFNQIPEKWHSKITGLKNDLFYAFIGFIKAQIIIMLISIIIASIGFSIIGVDYAITLGLLVGLAELIPVVGTGIIFVPWIIYMFIIKNFFVAIGLVCTYVLGVIVRQTVEPKIVGMQIGVYPLVTLISMYIGLELFGLFGMILGPIIVILLKNLNHSGIIHLWKEQ